MKISLKSENMFIIFKCENAKNKISYFDIEKRICMIFG